MVPSLWMSSTFANCSKKLGVVGPLRQLACYVLSHASNASLCDAVHWSHTISLRLSRKVAVAEFLAMLHFEHSLSAIWN